VPYLSALEVRSRRGTIQIHVYLYLYHTFTFCNACRFYFQLCTKARRAGAHEGLIQFSSSYKTKCDWWALSTTQDKTHLEAFAIWIFSRTPNLHFTPPSIPAVATAASKLVYKRMSDATTWPQLRELRPHGVYTPRVAIGRTECSVRFQQRPWPQKRWFRRKIPQSRYETSISADPRNSWNRQTLAQSLNQGCGKPIISFDHDSLDCCWLRCRLYMFLSLFEIVCLSHQMSCFSSVGLSV